MWTLLYLGSLVSINMVWDYIPVIIIYGVNWPPVSILVGLVFILRDYAQLEVGHKIILVMLAGVGMLLLHGNSANRLCKHDCIPSLRDN